jgi:2-phospho-L-lactate transferase/gluconeogenesis factor (CofD/UPF0052 family)
MDPALAEALIETDAHRVLEINVAPDGETEGFGAVDHLRVLLDHAPDLGLGTVLLDRSEAGDDRYLAELEALAGKCGARVVVADVACDDGSPRHDPGKLAAAYAAVLSGL